MPRSGSHPAMIFRMRRSSRVLVGSFVVVALAIGCGGGGGGSSAASGGGGASVSTAPESGPPPGWPAVLVAGPGHGAALFAGGEDNAPPFGYLREGVRVRVN